MDGLDRIVSMLYIKKEVLESSTYSFITRKSASKNTEHNKDRIADLRAFKEEVGINGMIRNNIQISISLWKKELETVMENI